MGLLLLPCFHLVLLFLVLQLLALGSSFWCGSTLLLGWCSCLQSCYSLSLELPFMLRRSLHFHFHFHFHLHLHLHLHLHCHCHCHCHFHCRIHVFVLGLFHLFLCHFSIFNILLFRLVIKDKQVVIPVITNDDVTGAGLAVFFVLVGFSPISFMFDPSVPSNAFTLPGSC